MTEEVRLYDLRKRDYPSKRGDSFRSLQVFKCWVCEALNNQVVMGGVMGYGVRSVCQHSAEPWHHALESKIRMGNPHHPASYRDELEKEIGEMRRSCKHLAVDDIVGTPDHTLMESVTNVHSEKMSPKVKAYFEDLEKRVHANKKTT